MDLFSGIGGLTIALEGLVRPVAYCENDRYAQAVLLSRMSDGTLPLAPIWDDITTLDASELQVPVDIIYGGFPCQDISVAGTKSGLEGERSGLFFEIIRLVREIRPQFIFLENVAGITPFLEPIARDLAALRYDCRWGMLSAYDVGAPHHRERWWCLAYNGQIRCDARRTEQPLSGIGISSASCVADIDEIGIHPRRQSVGTKTQDPMPNDTSESVDQCETWGIEPEVGRVVYGLPNGAYRIGALGNAVVPQQAREAFQRLIGFKGD